MKRAWLVILAFIIGFSTNVSGENLDSLVLNRVYSYQRNYTHQVNGFSTNVYIKHLFQTHQRNPTLWIIPSTYAIARGERSFVSEQYSRFTFNDIDDYDNQRQVYYTTIPRNRRTLPVLLDYLVPNLYHVTLYGNNILSPFNRENHFYYKYNITESGRNQARLSFRPRFVSNTQLVQGVAYIDKQTGRIDQVEMSGEFDMIRFHTLTMQGLEGARALLPRLCQMSMVFKFAGNHITSNIVALFDCPITLPDTLDVRGDRHLIDSIRPISLSDAELAIYAHHDSLIAARALKDSLEASADTVPAITEVEDQANKKHTLDLKKIGWDFIDDYLLHSAFKAETENGYVKLSPIVNPQYISYSRSKGISYKIKLGARYKVSDDVNLEFNPRLGYNFKLREFYYDLPFRLNYNKRNDGYVKVVWTKDNRIRNSTVLDEIKQEQGDLPELENKDLDLFDDNHLHVFNSISPYRWLTIETGLVYHQRHALNASEMQSMDKPTTYRSLAPSIGLKIRPWPKAPLLSIDYERGLPGKANYLEYERWEADISLKYNLKRLQVLNLRLGGGFYTKRNKNYFMDYANFRDNNLPEGWDDDWTGDFQLLSSDLYNKSSYYIRGNISYETPPLAASLVPVLGRYVERERVYLSSLSIENTRLYSELGYSFTCRLFSMGFFASFLNLDYQKMGFKFTFELFRRW